MKLIRKTQGKLSMSTGALGLMKFVEFMEASQPSVLNGSGENLGRIWAPTIRIPQIIIELIAPVITPFEFTLRLNIPIVKIPSRVPPVKPERTIVI
jgi:hypothetical protein